MNFKEMINENFDAVNAVAWGVMCSVIYSSISFDTADFIYETFMVISKASIVGFFGGLFGFLAKEIGTAIVKWIKSKL